MTTEPPRMTRSWIDFKFFYTADNGETFITSDRVYLDSSGNPVIPLTPMFLARQIQDTKTKFWGKSENLRKVEIKYSEPNNAQGFTETRRYNPYAPTEELKAYIQELRGALNSVFKSLDYCTDYRGENRFTIKKPNRINDNQNL